MTSFLKMHGLGNDFVVLDARSEALELSPSQVRRIADRHKGVGCDQLIVTGASKLGDIAMRIFNADGSEVEACGNATRCVAAHWMAVRGSSQCVVETPVGVLVAEKAGNGMVRVNMGAPRLKWQEIPLAEACDTLHVPISEGSLDAGRLGSGPADPNLLSDGVAVSMGNPHIVFFVANASLVELDLLGPRIEHMPFFPQRVNVSVAEIISPRRICLRVWERGAGETQACGTAACATMVAARRRGLVEPEAEILLPGGSLFLRWDGRQDTQNGPTLPDVWMTGPAAVSFTGVLEKSLLKA